ncbi:MAG: helix-turn-helix domain-containing protein [Chloracidobacterium sp.]|nr:helix-turn-helix domain-containing protein [Chloracidobacterium sp.]
MSRFRFIECTHEAFHLRRGYDTLLEREPTRVTPARRVESVRRFSSAGLSYRQIADRLNISKSTVARILKSDKP